MSLHFNWNRLDETCAEALRQLINKRLAEVVERINNKNASAPGAHYSSPSTAPQSGTTTATANAVGANFVAGGVRSNSKSSTVGVGGGTSAAASSALLGFGGAPGGVPIRADPSSNVSVHGSPRETYVGLLGAAEFPARSPFLSPSPASASTNALSAPPDAVGITRGGCSGGNGGLGGAAAGAPSQHNSNNSNISGSSAARVDTVRGGMSEETGVYGTRGVGSTALSGSVPSGNEVYNAGGKTRVPATASAATGVLYAVPGGGVSAVRDGDGGTLTTTATTEPRKVPPIVYLEVGSVEWGATPPFIEIVAFENATEGPPGYVKTSQRGMSGLNSVSAGSPLGDARDTPSYALSHAASTDTTMASSSAMLGCYAPPTTTATTTATTTPATAVAVGGSGTGEMGADNNSESSHDFTVSHSPTGVNTPRLVSGAHQQPAVASMLASGTSGAPPPPPHTQASVSLSHFPSQPETTDTLASVLGYGGLHIRFHITYGGALHLSLNTAVQHEIRLGAVALRVSLPMMFYLANLDLDCYLCINIKHNVCQIWLEHGPLSSSVVNRLSITATFGGDSEVDDGTADYGASSTDFYSRFGSSSISDDDGGDGSNGVYVNEHEVSQFVLHELRAILRETIVAPHCISIPISFDG